MLAPEGKPHLIILLFASLAVLVNFQEAYSNSYPNTAVFSFREYINDSYIARGNSDGMPDWMFTWVWSFILNIWFIGYLFGVFFTPYMTDNYGRKTSLIVANCISLCGSVLCTVGVWQAWPEVFFFGRIVSSFSTGVSFITLILFLQETTPTEMRGVCSFLSETAFIAMNVVGMGFGLNAVFGQHLVLLVGFGAIPGVVAVLIMFPLKETPKFLLIHKKDRKGATESLNFYRGKRKSYSDVISSILKESDEKIDMPLFKAIKEVFTQAHLRKALILGVASLQLAVGIWPILFLSTDILESHFSKEMSQYASFAFIIANFLASVFGTFFVDKFGRRPMMIGSGAVNTFFLFLYLIFDRLSAAFDVKYRYGCVASLIGYGMSYGAALGPIAFFITSELAAQRYRSLVQSIVFGINTLVNFVFSFVTLPMYEWISAWSFLPLFIIPSMVSLLYLHRNLPETKGREIHEIVDEMIRSAEVERRSTTSTFMDFESRSASEEDGESGGVRPIPSLYGSKRQEFPRSTNAFHVNALPVMTGGSKIDME